MRCGNAADPVVASCVSVNTHSDDVAQNQPNVAIVARRTEQNQERKIAASAAERRADSDDVKLDTAT